VYVYIYGRYKHWQRHPQCREENHTKTIMKRK